MCGIQKSECLQFPFLESMLIVSMVKQKEIGKSYKEFLLAKDLYVNFAQFNIRILIEIVSRVTI